MREKILRVSTNRLSRTRVLFVRLRVRKEVVTGVGAFNLANGNPRIYLSIQLYWHFDSRSDSRSEMYAYPISPDLEFQLPAMRQL